MAKGFTINIKGVEETIKNLRNAADDIADQVDFALAVNTEQMATEAKQRCVVDTGRLRASISANKQKKFLYELVAQANYAAYVEFGTGKGFIPLPEKEWMTLAGQFKGKGIKEVNLPARPYLRPSVNRIYPIMLKDIENILDKDERL